MDNRFGFKELVLSVLMIAIIIILLLKMKQDDRQWQVTQRVLTKLEEQSEDLRRIHEALRGGVRVGVSVEAAGQAEGAGPFARMIEARKQPDFAMGDWYVEPFGQAVGKLTPLVSSDAYGSAVGGYVLESLAQRNPDTLEWEPLIARSWQVSEDGLTISFELRTDVRFSDGRPLTAADVVFTFDWIMNPKVDATRTRAYFDKIAQVKADGEHKVTFTFREPYFKSFEIAAGMDVLARHYYGQFSEAQFNQLPGLLFGSGPYKLPMDPAAWQPGTGQIELVRNDRYWGVQPAFDRMVWREITDETARLVAFRNGEVDQFSPQPAQYLQLKEDQNLRKTKKFFEYDTIVGGYRYVAWNQKRDGKPSIFADKRVRQALTLLADRQEMSQRLMVGLATPTSGPFHRLGKQANPAIEPWPFDPQRARELLREAGFADRDGDGVIESSDGRPFRFKLIYPSTSQNYMEMALYLKDAYARAGIVLDPDPLEWTIMIQRIDERNFDAMTLGWTGTIESDPFQIFHSSQIVGGGDNYIQYENPQLDALIDQARVTMDEEQRLKLWHQVHAILHEDQPYTFLWTTRAVVLVDGRIRNIEELPLGLNPRTEWFVPRPQQKWGK